MAGWATRRGALAGGARPRWGGNIIYFTIMTIIIITIFLVIIIAKVERHAQSSEDLLQL